MPLSRSSRTLLWISAIPLLSYPLVAWPLFEYFISPQSSLNEWWFTLIINLFSILMLTYPISWNLFRLSANKYVGQRHEQMAAYGALSYAGIMFGLGALIAYFLTININALIAF